MLLQSFGRDFKEVLVSIIITLAVEWDNKHEINKPPINLESENGRLIVSVGLA